MERVNFLYNDMNQYQCWKYKVVLSVIIKRALMSILGINISINAIKYFVSENGHHKWFWYYVLIIFLIECINIYSWKYVLNFLMMVCTRGVTELRQFIRWLELNLFIGLWDQLVEPRAWAQLKSCLIINLKFNFKSI